MKKIFVYSMSAVIVLAFIVWKLKSNKEENARNVAIVKESSTGAVPVQVETVKRSTLNEDFSANGNFEAIHQIELTSELAGRITQLYVQEGSVVKAGQTLAKVDSEILNADFQSEKAKVQQARQDLERYQKALSTGGVTQKQVDDMKTQYETAQSRYVQATRNLNNTLIKAPANGMVNEKFVEIGSYLSPGSKVFEIVDLSRLKLAVRVPETQVVQLHVGDTVNVGATVYPEVAYKGRIAFIAPKGDAALNYRVEIEIANIRGKELKDGMYGTANFSLAKQTPAIFIPRAAFVGGVNSNQVFMDSNGKANLRHVVAGRTFGDRVEIRKGLSEDERVIVSGQINLSEGTPVSVQP